MERHYPCMIAAGTLLLAEELTRLEGNKERKRKKERVLERKRDMLRDAFSAETAGLSLKGDADQMLTGEWPRHEALTFIIDLSFVNPFAPYQLKFQDRDFEDALKKVGALVGLKVADVQRVRRTQRDALRVHRHIAWGKIALWGVGGIIVLGVGGWLLAPVIGGAIGAAAGLSGAAATSHGLAILGGGSLAIGGMGMAGGMWVVTGTGAAFGLLGAGGATLLLQMGAANARVELSKLQVNYKEVILGTQMELKKAQEVITSLTQQRDEIRQRLEEESKLNEKNSARLKDMEATLEALENSLKWMETVYSQSKEDAQHPSPDGKGSATERKEAD